MIPVFAISVFQKIVLHFFCLRSGYEMRIGFEKFGWIDLYVGIWDTLGFDLIFFIQFSFSVYLSKKKNFSFSVY